MNLSVTAYMIIGVILGFWFFHSKRKTTRHLNQVQLLEKRIAELYANREALAKMLLLRGIAPGRIRYVQREERHPGLTFSVSSELHGLLVSNPTPEEMELLTLVDKLLDGKLPRRENTYQIPGRPTPEEAAFYSRP